MRVIVLGSAAGGGFPQWNCNCENCKDVRTGATNLRPRSQSSVAVTKDGEQWFLLNCSPDLRQQIAHAPCLWPRGRSRHSPIAGALLTNGDVDHIAGLLTLREGQPLVVQATRSILETLRTNSIFNVLDSRIVRRKPVVLGERTELLSPSGPSGLSVEVFTVPGKTALYLEDDQVVTDVESEQTVGLKLESDSGAFYYIPACARMTSELAARLDGAALVMWDGTVWQDDEMVRKGLGTKTGGRMGHMSISGEGGSLEAFRRISVGRKIFVHINNTNPILREDSAERSAVTAAGWEVAHDGMEICL